jgi:PAS domain-containing protein
MKSELIEEDFAQAIVETAPPLLILDVDLRVKTANESFYRHFQVSPPQTENCKVFELGNGQFNIPTLRTLLEQILPERKSFNAFKLTHEFEAIGRRTVLLSGRQVDSFPKIILFIDDITEQVESRAVQRNSEIRYRRLFEAARDGILILDAGTRKITDANPFMSEILGYPYEELMARNSGKSACSRMKPPAAKHFGTCSGKASSATRICRFRIKPASAAKWNSLATCMTKTAGKSFNAISATSPNASVRKMPCAMPTPN